VHFVDQALPKVLPDRVRAAATATRDLVDLVAKSILRSDGAGGRSAGYVLIMEE
jgi:hypothetical protein